MYEEIVDAAGHPDPTVVRLAGYVGIAGYLSQSSPKAITPTEAQAVFDEDLALVLVYEDGAQDALDSALMVQHASVAKEQLASLPLTGRQGVLYVAVDFGATSDQYEALWANILGFGQVAGVPVAPYGPAPFVTYCMSRGCSYGWQSAGWAGGVLSGAQIVQQVRQITLSGVTCDVDSVCSPEFGQWAVSPPSNEGEDVPLTTLFDAQGNLHVLGIQESTGHLLHFSRPAGTATGSAHNGWQVDDVTDEVGGAPYTVEG